MADTTISPNMNMPVPVVGIDPGTDWANNVNACLNIVDSHNHSSGEGVAINPDGLNINDDLPINDNNLTTVKSVRYESQGSPLAGVSDLDCTYVSGVDLYYNDGNGNQIRMTASGSPALSGGTITGLPSGTAGASFSGSTFTFVSATATLAQMQVGPLIIGRNVANSKTVTITPASGQASNYNTTLPTALPSVQSAFVSSSAGVQSFLTLQSSTYTPTFSRTGNSVVPTSTSYYQIGNAVTVFGYATPLNGSSGTIIMTLPVTPSSFASPTDALTRVSGFVFSYNTSPGTATPIATVIGTTGSITVTLGDVGAATGTQNISFSYSYRIS